MGIAAADFEEFAVGWHRQVRFKLKPLRDPAEAWGVKRKSRGRFSLARVCEEVRAQIMRQKEGALLVEQTSGFVFVAFQ